MITRCWVQGSRLGLWIWESATRLWTVRFWNVKMRCHSKMTGSLALETRLPYESIRTQIVHLMKLLMRSARSAVLPNKYDKPEPPCDSASGSRDVVTSGKSSWSDSEPSSLIFISASFPEVTATPEIVIFENATTEWRSSNAFWRSYLSASASPSNI